MITKIGKYHSVLEILATLTEVVVNSKLYYINMDWIVSY